MGFRAGHRQSNLDSLLSKNPHDLRAPDERVLVHVLVPVDEKPWLRPFDVAVECFKADVNPVVIGEHEEFRGKSAQVEAIVWE